MDWAPLCNVSALLYMGMDWAPFVYILVWTEHPSPMQWYGCSIVLCNHTNRRAGSRCTLHTSTSTTHCTHAPQYTAYIHLNTSHDMHLNTPQHITSHAPQHTAHIHLNTSHDMHLNTSHDMHLNTSHDMHLNTSHDMHLHIT